MPETWPEPGTRAHAWGTMLPSSPRPSARVSLLGLFVLCLVSALPRSAAAWIEMDVRTHRATLTVEANAQAEVRHDLLLRVRGGPLQALEIEGVGQEIEPLGDATVRAVGKGLGRVWPMELEARDDGVLVLRVGAEKGLRSGVYRFEFGYRLDVSERGWLEGKGDRARITWVQPRFSSGIDSAQVVFRVPRAAAMPSLPDDEDGPAAAVLLTEVRRGSDFDEVELIRAHVARGEPAVWQVDVDGSIFPGLAAEPDAEAAISPVVSPPRRLLLPRTPFWVWLFGGALGLVYAVVLWVKGRALRRTCTELGIRERTLVPLPAGIRVPLAGALLGVAATLALLESPTLAGLAWAGALLLAALLPPWREPKPRGPGEWVRLRDEELAHPPRRVASGRWLDASDPRGAFLLAVIVAATLGAAWSLLPISPYRAGLTLASASAWLPVFLTGRSVDLPADPAWGALPLYLWLAKRLSRDQAVSTELWARRPLHKALHKGSSVPSTVPDAVPQELAASRSPAPGATAAGYDELRLRLLREGALPGVRAVEVGVEVGGGLVALPCVIVRVQDESLAYRALPHTVHWVRGRSAEERVAILRPRLPTRNQCLELATGVLRRLSSAPGATQARRAPGAAATPRARKSPRRAATPPATQSSSGAGPSPAPDGCAVPRPV